MSQIKNSSLSRAVFLKLSVVRDHFFSSIQSQTKKKKLQTNIIIKHIKNKFFENEMKICKIKALMYSTCKVTFQNKRNIGK